MNAHRDAVAEALVELGWAVDRRDWDDVAGLLAATSAEQLAAQWRDSLGRLDATQHVVAGVRITAEDGDTVQATAIIVATHVRGSAAQRLWTLGGWWHTTLQRSGDRYLISQPALYPSWQTRRHHRPNRSLTLP